MKQITFMAVLFCLLASANRVCADNYFTLRADTISAVNDTLRLIPCNNNYDLTLYAVAHSDGYFDHWYLEMTHPDSLPVYVNQHPLFPTDPFDGTLYEGPAMTVPYYDSTGTLTETQANLLTKVVNIPLQETNDYMSYFGSTITQTGYWDQYNTGNYQPYGTVKWGPGNHDFMFSFKINIPNNLIHTDITFATTMTSTADLRDIDTVNVVGAEKTIHIWVAFKKGDVNGDGYVNIGDVRQLIDWLLDGFQGATFYQRAACDVNGDGQVSQADITYLIDEMLGLNSYELSI